MSKPILYIIIPCYNEEQVLPTTSKMFLEKLRNLVSSERVDSKSRIMFVNDGSKDSTWDIIKKLSEENTEIIGIAQSRNRGHQNSLLAGLMEAKDKCDITISIDCDGQDDIDAMDEMISEYETGSEIVYGIRDNRETDTFFKRTSAQLFYKLMKSLGVDTVYNHADYRLISSRVLQEFAKFEEVNLFLRGMIPLVGFKSSAVCYKRAQRLAGESHYPLGKMLGLAIDGITSLSIKPIRLITGSGILFALISFAGIIWAIVRDITGHTVTGWASMTCIICFIGGIQMISLGVIGEYIGKVYLETKKRPRYIISDRTDIDNKDAMED